MGTTSEIVREFERTAQSASTPEELMTVVVRRLQQEKPHYNWVGFYMIEPGSEPPMLVLGPYVGAPTPHTRIPLNQGICGAAASSGETVVVSDVNSDPRYLACSIETKSEIVAPVFVNGKVAGEIDIDSHEHAAFTHEDRTLVEECAALVGHFMERVPAQ